MCHFFGVLPVCLYSALHIFSPVFLRMWVLVPFSAEEAQHCVMIAVYRVSAYHQPQSIYKSIRRHRHSHFYLWHTVGGGLCTRTRHRTEHCWAVFIAYLQRVASDWSGRRCNEGRWQLTPPLFAGRWSRCCVWRDAWDVTWQFFFVHLWQMGCWLRTAHCRQTSVAVICILEGLARAQRSVQIGLTI
jgi:hypothetical protein